MWKSAFLSVFSIPYSVQKARAVRGKEEEKNGAWRGMQKSGERKKSNQRGNELKKRVYKKILYVMIYDRIIGEPDLRTEWKKHFDKK